jgi:hypothetical protein
MDEIPNRTNMVLQFLRKRQCFAHQTADALSQCVVQTLDMETITMGESPVSHLSLVSEGFDDFFISPFVRSGEVS